MEKTEYTGVYSRMYNQTLKSQCLNISKKEKQGVEWTF